MQRWYLSYHSPDRALAEQLKAAIERKDSASRVFFAPTSLRAGAFWLPELAKGISEATAFLLLVGEKGLGPQQVIEYYEALDRHVMQPNFPVMLVLLDGQFAPGLPFLRRMHWIISAEPTSEQTVGQILDTAAGGGAMPRELWRHTAPYRGLFAMDEKDSDYFFGRGPETTQVLEALASSPDKLPLLFGSAGVGKSSLAQAGVMGALMRQDWPLTDDAKSQWPRAFHDSRRWCLLKMRPGTQPLRSLVESFVQTWQFEAVDPRRADSQAQWVEQLLDGRVDLTNLLDATQARYRDELHQPEPSTFLLYIDQAEELYVRAEEQQRRRFSECVARALSDRRLRAMMSMRADFFGELQRDEPLFAVHRLINVPPMREAQLHEVVTRPAKLLSARFESAELADIIVRRTVEDSAKDAGALPLLSYALDDMWTRMVWNGDGVLRVTAASFETGSVLIDRADHFIAAHPGAEDAMRRLLTLRLATVREDGEPTRRRASRSECTEDEWLLVSALAEHPYRLLVTVTTETGESYAEVAHDAIFRRWSKLRDWIAIEREFLAWRNGLEADRRFWEMAPDQSKDSALLMGLRLEQGKMWLAQRPRDILKVDRVFIARSLEQSTKSIGRRWPTTFQWQRQRLAGRPSPRPLGSKVFISYRRSDTKQMAGRVYERLSDEFSEQEIFFDIDTIPMGVNFREHISEAILESAVLLLLIGDKWLRPGPMRWFATRSAEDFVYTEIELSLEYGLPILPLLVDDAEMPKEHEVPKSIADFVLRNAALVRSGRDFKKDMERVIENIKTMRAQTSTQ
jgi:hypothetical protein